MDKWFICLIHRKFSLVLLSLSELSCRTCYWVSWLNTGKVAFKDFIHLFNEIMKALSSICPTCINFKLLTKNIISALMMLLLLIHLLMKYIASNIIIVKKICNLKTIWLGSLTFLRLDAIAFIAYIRFWALNFRKFK